MSRTGVEDKLPWKEVPQAVRQEVAAILGTPILRAMRVWGGYGPTPTYRLLLADGRRAFLKATFQDFSMPVRDALLAEERVYRDLGTVLGKWMPQLYATFQYNDWHVLILEDLGSESVLPWTSQRIRQIAHALAAFHQSTLSSQPLNWLSQPAEVIPRENWQRTAQDSLQFQTIAALSGIFAPQALTWLQHISPTIDRLMQRSALKEGPHAILHGDLRSDNLRFTRGHLYLFDWPAITLGRPEWDIVAFAQTITVEGGPSPEQVLGWYGEQFPLRAEAVECALAWWLTFFANRAWRPEVPGLPRLRRFQRQQLAVLLLWAARQWSFPSPEWAEQLLV